MLNERLFMGCYPRGIVFSDRGQERHGDYRRLAILRYGDLVLEFETDCPKTWKPIIKAKAAAIQARRGQEYPYSQTQTITLGFELD